MAWHSLTPLLGFLLIWTTTTEGQVTDESSFSTPTYTNFLTPETLTSATTPTTTSTEATTAGILPIITQLVTTGSGSTTPITETSIPPIITQLVTDVPVGMIETLPTTTTTTTLPSPTSADTTAGTTLIITQLETTGISSTGPPSESTEATTAVTTLGSPALTTDVPQCNPACADNELCTNSAGYTECKCQRSKYLNASRSDIVPTVQCEGSAMTLSLNKCLLERFNYSFTQMHFEDTNCIASPSLQLEGNERVVQITANPQATWCGNEMLIYDKTVTYSNVLYIPPDDASGIIISSSLRFNFSCTYNLTMQTSLLTALHPLLINVTGPSENDSGSISATMAAFKSNSFNDPVLEDDTLTVGTPVYIGISTTFPDGDTFTLRAERCVASPSINPADPSVELISGGCAMTQTMNVQVVENGQSLQVMFEIEAFIFNGQPDVYMWCDVSLCPKDPSTTCQCSSSSGSAGP